jgi:hypothetical protein
MATMAQDVSWVNFELGEDVRDESRQKQDEQWASAGENRESGELRRSKVNSRKKERNLTCGLKMCLLSL